MHASKSGRSDGVPCHGPPKEREKVHWEEQRKAMQADQYNKAELARRVHACSHFRSCAAEQLR
jgi:hypothetical protein